MLCLHNLDFALLTLTLVLPFTTALFQLDYPPARGYNASSLDIFPCGGQDNVSSNRTMFSMGNGPIQLNMDSDRANVQVLLGLGDVVGVNFNITLVPIFQEIGMGHFCMEDVVSSESGQCEA